MKKLRLRLDALTVESFHSAGDAEGHGTVQAFSYTEGTRCTYDRDCYTDLANCTQACTGGLTCYPITC